MLQLTSPKATDIKCSGKQPQVRIWNPVLIMTNISSKDAPSTKDDIHMILGHLHSVVKLEKNQTTKKDTRPIPEERSAPSLLMDHRISVQRTHCETCQCNSRPSDSDVLVKTRISCQSKNRDLVACLKVRFATNSRETKTRKRGRPSA